MRAAEGQLAESAARLRLQTGDAHEQRLASHAAEILAHLEREAGRVQERACRVVAAAARREVDRRVGRSVSSALREIEDKLTATMAQGSAAGGRASVTQPNEAEPG